MNYFVKIGIGCSTVVSPPFIKKRNYLGTGCQQVNLIKLSLINKLLYHYFYKSTIYVGNYSILVYIIFFKFFVI